MTGESAGAALVATVVVMGSAASSGAARNEPCEVTDGGEGGTVLNGINGADP
jgi:hypothetical protein